MLVETIRNNIGSFEHQEAKPNKTTRQAAVAIIVREINSQLEMLFIKRAEKEGDPWSGHMAFPGGHREPDDLGLKEAAERETLEEIGMEAVEEFEENGGEKLHVVPCINDRDDWVELLSKWIKVWNEKVLEKI